MKWQQQKEEKTFFENMATYLEHSIVWHRVTLLRIIPLIPRGQLPRAQWKPKVEDKCFPDELMSWLLCRLLRTLCCPASDAERTQGSLSRPQCACVLATITAECNERQSSERSRVEMLKWRPPPIGDRSLSGTHSTHQPHSLLPHIVAPSQKTWHGKSPVSTLVLFLNLGRDPGYRLRDF